MFLVKLFPCNGIIKIIKIIIDEKYIRQSFFVIIKVGSKILTLLLADRSEPILTQPAMNRYLIRAADAITGFSPNTDFCALYRLVNSHCCRGYCSSWYIGRIRGKIWFLRGWEKEKLSGRKGNCFSTGRCVLTQCFQQTLIRQKRGDLSNIVISLLHQTLLNRNYFGLLFLQIDAINER